MAAESRIPRCIPVISDLSLLSCLLSSGQGENWSHGLRYNYADNFGVVRSTEANATEMYSMIAQSVIRVGLQVHDEVRATCDAETLGVRLRFRQNGSGDFVVSVVNFRNSKEHADVFW